MFVYMYMCMCMCICERKGEERDEIRIKMARREKGMEGGVERLVIVSLSH